MRRRKDKLCLLLDGSRCLDFVRLLVLAGERGPGNSEQAVARQPPGQRFRVLLYGRGTQQVQFLPGPRGCDVEKAPGLSIFPPDL